MYLALGLFNRESGRLWEFEFEKGRFVALVGELYLFG